MVVEIRNSSFSTLCWVVALLLVLTECASRDSPAPSQSALPRPSAHPSGKGQAGSRGPLRNGSSKKNPSIDEAGDTDVGKLALLRSPSVSREADSHHSEASEQEAERTEQKSERGEPVVQTSPPLQTPTIADDEVFVPLEEWKERKIEIIAKKASKASALRAKAARRMIKGMYVTRRALLRSFLSQNVCPARIVRLGRTDDLDSSEGLQELKVADMEHQREGQGNPPEPHPDLTEDAESAHASRPGESAGENQVTAEETIARTHKPNDAVPNAKVEHSNKTAELSSEDVVAGSRGRRTFVPDGESEQAATSRSEEEATLSRSRKMHSVEGKRDSAVKATRTGKPRAEISSQKHFNFASVDAGARVLGASSNSVGSKNVISDNKDKYMLVPCESDGPSGARWIDIELSEDIFLKSLETANFEFYSSNAKRLAILSARKYPPESWQLLGLFNVEDTRELQRFVVNRRVITRYIKVMFLGKQGSEHYCPTTVVRVLGKRLIDDWHDYETIRDSRASIAVSDERSGERGARVKTDLNLDQAAVPADGDGRNTADRSTGGSDIPSRAAKDGRKRRGIRDASVGKDDSKSSDLRVRRSREADGPDSVHKEAQGRSPTEDQHVLGDPPSLEQDLAYQQDETSSRVYDELSEEERIILDAIREESMTPVTKEESIYRKITRMIRLLEVNQSLTNQYIDTHLAKFAAKLAQARNDARNAVNLATDIHSKLQTLAQNTQESFDNLASETFKRDIVIGVLFTITSLLLASQLILRISSSQLQLSMRERSQEELASFNRYKRSKETPNCVTERGRGLLSYRSNSLSGKRRGRKNRRRHQRKNSDVTDKPRSNVDRSLEETSVSKTFIINDNNPFRVLDESLTRSGRSGRSSPRGSRDKARSSYDMSQKAQEFPSVQFLRRDFEDGKPEHDRSQRLSE